jgi:hypothetical protein
MLELKHQKQNKLSIAWKIEIHNSYLFANVSTKRVNSEKLGLWIYNLCRSVSFFFLCRRTSTFLKLILTDIFGIPQSSATHGYVMHFIWSTLAFDSINTSTVFLLLTKQLKEYRWKT